MEHQLVVDPHQTCTRSPGNIPAPRTYRETSGQDDNCYEDRGFHCQSQANMLRPQQNRVTVANVRTGMCQNPRIWLLYGTSTAKPCDSCHFSSTNLPKPKENTHSKIDGQKSGSGRENRNVENLVKDSNFLSSSTFNVTILHSGSAFWQSKKAPSTQNEGMCSIHGERCDRGHLLPRLSKIASAAWILLPHSLTKSTSAALALSCIWFFKPRFVSA